MTIKAVRGSNAGWSLVPVQLGESPMPRTDYEIGVNWSVRETHGQNTFFDSVYDQATRSPLEPGRLSYSARYRTCSKCGCFDCDFDKLHSYLGAWTPLMMARVPHNPKANCAECCTQYIWTMAKLMNIDANFGATDFRGQSSPFNFEIMLSGPFIEADHTQWRYGGRPEPVPTPTCGTMQQFEALLSHSALTTMIPCGLPPCCPAKCSEQSFWYRPIQNTGFTCVTLESVASMPNKITVSNGCRYLEITGGFEPLTAITLSAGASIGIVSDTFDSIFSYMNQTAGVVTIDPEGGVVDANCGHIVSCRRPRLGVGSNAITVSNGTASVAWRRRWLR